MHAGIKQVYIGFQDHIRQKGADVFHHSMFGSAVRCARLLARIAFGKRQVSSITLSVRIAGNPADEQFTGPATGPGAADGADTADLGFRRLDAGPRLDVRSQPLFAVSVHCRNDECVFYPRMVCDRGLNLARFNSKATNFHLRICAAQELIIPSRRPSARGRRFGTTALPMGQ